MSAKEALTERDLLTAVAIAEGCRVITGACGDGLQGLSELHERLSEDRLREDEAAFVELCATVRRQVAAFSDRWLP